MCATSKRMEMEERSSAPPRPQRMDDQDESDASEKGEDEKENYIVN